MKKLLLSLICGVFILSATLCYGYLNEEFIGSKAQILFVYKAFETNAFKISLFYEQRAEEMHQKEQAAVLLARSDLELGMEVTKGILALYTLQGVQESTSPEAANLLIGASLDASELLVGLRERFVVRGVDIKDEEIRKVINESIELIDNANKAIAVLAEATSEVLKKN